MRAIGRISGLSIRLSEQWISKAIQKRGPFLPDGSAASKESLQEIAVALSDRFLLPIESSDHVSRARLELAYKEVNSEQGGPFKLERGIVGSSQRPLVMPAAELVYSAGESESRLDSSFDSKRVKAKIRSMIHRVPALLKAIGWRRDRERTVLDCTGGLGHDAIAMARFGGTRVVSIERNPLVAAAFSVGMERLHHDKDLVDIADEGRLQLLHDDASHVMRRILRKNRGSSSSIGRPDVVYLDPMFARGAGSGKASKSAPKAGAQVLAGVVVAGRSADDASAAGDAQKEEERIELLQLAMLVAKERVVVKTHKSAPVLQGALPVVRGMVGARLGGSEHEHLLSGGEGSKSKANHPGTKAASPSTLAIPKPMFAVPGKAVRFDVYGAFAGQKRDKALRDAANCGLLDTGGPGEGGSDGSQRATGPVLERLLGELHERTEFDGIGGRV